MSIYSITQPSEQALRLLLNAGGGEETLLLQRPENSLRAQVLLEQAGSKLAASIHIGDRTETMLLQANDPANANHIADYIEALANGNAETAAPMHMRAPQQQRPQLNSQAASRLLHTCTHGGHVEILPGMHITVAGEGTKRTAIAAFKGCKPHLVSGSVRDVLSSLTEHTEQLLAA